MSGPQTISGQALLSAAARPPTFEVSIAAEALRDAILAIEREAVAAFLASPEAAEGLARALQREWDEHWTYHESEGWDESASAILAAWQQERAK